MVETSTGQATATMDTAGEKIADKVLMYACIFTYEKPKVRSGINNFVCTTNCKFAFAWITFKSSLTFLIFCSQPLLSHWKMMTKAASLASLLRTRTSKENSLTRKSMKMKPRRRSRRS